MANTRDKLSEEHLREILLRALKQSEKLSLYIQIWEDMDVDNPRRTHQSLLNIITKRLAGDQMEVNHRRGRPAAQSSAAPAPKDKAKGKASGRGGGDGKKVVAVPVAVTPRAAGRAIKAVERAIPEGRRQPVAPGEPQRHHFA